MKFEPKIYKLGKLRIVLVKEQRESVTVRAIIGTGSREESDIEAGSAHFLEHFVFKGTKEFPGVFDLKEAIETVGGDFNAYTGQNEMGFWVKLDKNNLPLAIKIVGQITTSPLLPSEHFDKERETILEELYMYEDMPNSKAAETMVSTLYGNTNLGRPIIGTVESLKGMTVTSLRAYFDKWFVPENIIIGVVGDYGTEDQVLEYIKKEFEKLINNENVLPNKNVFSWDTQLEVRKTLITRELDQAAVYMGFRGLPIKHKLHYALELTNQILGGGWMSRLLKEVRENRGWAYSIGSGIDEYADVGDLIIGAGLPKNKLNEAIELITEISLGLGGNSKWEITQKELDIAKETYKGRLALAFDKPETVLGVALEDLMFEGDIKTPDYVIDKINKVTMKDIKEVCNLVFKPSTLSIAVVGNYKNLDFKI